MPTHLCFALAVLAAIGGCIGSEPRSNTDEGTLCLDRAPAFQSKGEPPRLLLENQPLKLGVENSASLGGCEELGEAKCSAALEGSTIVVTSEFHWTTATGPKACNDISKIQTALCETPVLAAGTYTVRFGSTERTITVPGPLDSPCLRSE